MAAAYDSEKTEALFSFILTIHIVGYFCFIIRSLLNQS